MGLYMCLGLYMHLNRVAHVFGVCWDPCLFLRVLSPLNKTLSLCLQCPTLLFFMSQSNWTCCVESLKSLSPPVWYCKFKASPVILQICLGWLESFEVFWGCLMNLSLFILILSSCVNVIPCFGWNQKIENWSQHLFPAGRTAKRPQWAV